MAETDSKKFIMFSDKVGLDDVALVGGKCANLGQMNKYCIPVPQFFAVTTLAYDKVLKDTGAQYEINKYLSKYTGGLQFYSMGQIEDVSNTIYKIIVDKKIPREISDVIKQAYDNLSEMCSIKDVPVAIRSSGVCEDMAGASFAGQYDSYLNIQGKQKVLEYVIKCWASMFTPRCVSYRLRHGLGILAGSVSVGIQKMVNARSAGVGFTIDPNTNDRSKIVLEGNWGAGETVVQGFVDPDIFVFNKENCQLIDSRIGKKLKECVLTQNGTIEKDVPTDKQNVPCLKMEEGQKIAEIARNLENIYGMPLDIEWSIDKDFDFPHNIFIVQCRPVTTLKEQQSPSEKVLNLLLSRVFSHKC